MWAGMLSWLDFLKKNKKPGLEVKFKKGEQLPWKGIFFVVEGVTYDRIILTPIGLTWQKAKKLKSERRYEP